MSGVVQLAMPVPPAVDFDPWALIQPSAWEDCTESLLTIAGQARRRMWGRREAVTVLLWRLYHAPRRRSTRGRQYGKPTAAHAAEIEAVAWHVAGLAHLDDLDQEDPRPELGPVLPPGFGWPALTLSPAYHARRGKQAA